MPEDDNTGWLIAPAGRCTTMVVEAFMLAGVLQRSAAAAASQGILLDIARSALEQAGQPTDSVDAVLAEQPHLERLISELSVLEPFGPIERQAVILMCVAVEVCVEDTARAIIEHSADAVQRLFDDGILPRKDSSPERADPYTDRIYRSLERSAKDATRPGRVAERYSMILANLGLQLDLRPQTPDVLAEMNYVRNCLLHRAGIADARAGSQAPALGTVSGQPLLVSRERISDYSTAASDFATALVAAATNSQYVHRRQ